MIIKGLILLFGALSFDCCKINNKIQQTFTFLDIYHFIVI